MLRKLLVATAFGAAMASPINPADTSTTTTTTASGSGAGGTPTIATTLLTPKPTDRPITYTTTTTTASGSGAGGTPTIATTLFTPTIATTLLTPKPTDRPTDRPITFTTTTTTASGSGAGGTPTIATTFLTPKPTDRPITFTTTTTTASGSGAGGTPTIATTLFTPRPTSRLTASPTPAVQTAPQCKVADDCTALNLFAPDCIGKYECVSNLCKYFCDTIYTPLTNVTQTKCPDGTDMSVALDRCSLNGGRFVSDTCNCVFPLCPDGKTRKVDASSDCLINQKGSFDPLTCTCSPIIVNCPSSFEDSCKDVGGVVDLASCTCKREVFCPAPMNTVPKLDMKVKCNSANLGFNWVDCTCIQPPAITEPMCTYALASEPVPVTKAKAECLSRGVDSYVFAYDLATNMCSCRPVFLTVNQCPDNVTPVAVAERACGIRGFYASPRTYNFLPNTCECVPVDTVPVIDCGSFKTCTADAPCLQRSGICVAQIPGTTFSRPFCPDFSVLCSSFGNGGAVGEVCPDGTPYATAKDECAKRGYPATATWYPLGCKCESIVVADTNVCPDGSDYAIAFRSCVAKTGFFEPSTCTCKDSLNSLQCKDPTLEPSAAKDACARKIIADPSLVFLPPPECACVSKESYSDRTGCDLYSSLDEAMKLCPGAAADPPTALFDARDCSCRRIVAQTSTALVSPPELLRQVFKLSICRDGLTLVTVRDSVVKLIETLKVRFALASSDISVAFLGLEPAQTDNCFILKFEVLEMNRATLVDLIPKLLATASPTAGTDLEAAVISSLRSGGEFDEMPAKLGLTADGPIIAPTSIDIDNTSLSGAAATSFGFAAAAAVAIGLAL